MFSSSLLVVSLLSLARATPIFRNLVVHEARSDVPAGFVSSGPAPADRVLNLRIALAQSDPAGLEKALLDVSTPSSALYGQHLTQEEVEAFVKPSPDTVSIVNEWLSANGLSATPISPAGDWLTISIPVSKANALLNAKFTTFNHPETGTSSTLTMAYSIPTELKGHVELVHPTISFPNPFGLPVISAPLKAAPAANVSSDAVPASCATTVTPACLQALYGIPTALATQASNKLGVSGFIQQFANQADLKTFLTALRPDLSSATTFTLTTLDGGTNPQGANQAGVEANLDIQYTVGVASGVPTSFISVGPNNGDNLGGFLDIITFLQKQTTPPQVLTTSYGQNENTVSKALANSLCNAYQQLGARGVSILFASGDGGVSGSQSARCTNFVPTFPSGCPFMTSVGATTAINPETAATFSSGGFSNVFTAPSYQSSAVSAYLTSIGTLNSGKFNKAGRAFPDVSAQGQNVEIVVGGKTGLVAGTSCSSPIFASIVSLLNDRLVAAGKPVLGFLNPFLYANPGAFNDVTTGSNPGCNTNGFPAKAGWDPVTGLGTPNFAKLLAAAGL
ncbi:family S53 protease-like protein [Rickenella mellea]|uniref:tripeptidyl-peptidase II n=1 Tax=Rickenella mellea TaxID=50990 RepID=A0A4Y7Q3S1_9AGAM|nr:family S53 protease-like protein [Rickenella mellea]